LVLLTTHAPAQFPRSADLLYTKNVNTNCLVATAAAAETALDQLLRQHLLTRYSFLDGGMRINAGCD